MEENPLQSPLLTRWQHLHVQDQVENCDVSSKADLLRNLLAQIQYARASEVTSTESIKMLMHADLTRYGDIVDKGVGCYTEEVLALVQDNQTEKRQWKTSLTLESALELNTVQQFLKENEATTSALFPSGNINEPLLLGPTVTTDAGRSSDHRSVELSSRQPLFQPSNHQSANSSHDSLHPVSNGSKMSGSAVGRGGAGSSWNGETRLEGEWRGNRRHPLGTSGKTATIAGSESGNLWSGPTLYSRQDSLKRPLEDTTVEFEEERCSLAASSFRTARDQLAIEEEKKPGRVGGGSYGTSKKCLGTRRGPGSRFVPPVVNRDDSDDGGCLVKAAGPNKGVQQTEGEVDERLKNIDAKMIELITNEIIDHGPAVTWDQIAGLQFAKKTIREIVIWPMLRPDIFTGLRGPPKGLLLFGPPGTGKTLIGKCIACQSKSTFFSISASSLTSKWVGEGEKMVRALFAVARTHQPAVIFIDEIDSLLSQRTDGEHESSRRIKTEFLVQLDGATTAETDRILVVGATNRPQEIDEAARRRFVKRLYIPLPDSDARRHIVTTLMHQQTHCLTDQQLTSISEQSHGFSGADMTSLCREAALGPIRTIEFTDIEDISADQVRPINYADFEAAFRQVKPSVTKDDLHLYIEWNNTFGSWAM